MLIRDDTSPGVCRFHAGWDNLPQLMPAGVCFNPSISSQSFTPFQCYVYDHAAHQLKATFTAPAMTLTYTYKVGAARLVQCSAQQTYRLPPHKGQCSTQAIAPPLCR